MLNTYSFNNTTASIHFSVTSFKGESLNMSESRPYLFICHEIQYSPIGQCHYYKANLLKWRQLPTLCNYFQLINLFLSFMFQETKQIDLFMVGRLAFLFSCLLLLFSACLFLRPCETFMNAVFYKSFWQGCNKHYKMYYILEKLLWSAERKKYFLKIILCIWEN